MAEQYTPRPWQELITDHILKTPRSNVWAGMGSGKTVATLTALDLLDLTDDVWPTLVLSTKRVAVGVWPLEVEKWAHLRHLTVSVIQGTAKQRRQALYAKADIYTMNYENLEWLVETIGEHWPFRTVIADESTKLKGFRMRSGTKRSMALAKVARKPSRWVNLTGTPASNGLKDLWGQNWFVDHGHRLGRTWTAFKNRWFDHNPFSHEFTPKPFAQSQIHKAIGDITLAVDIADWVTLDEPIVVPVHVDLPTDAMHQYKEFERKLFVELSKDTELNAQTAAARTTKCLQLAAGAVWYEDEGERKWVETHTAKLDALESIVEETAGANIVVFYWWKHDVARIQKRFKQARVLNDKNDEADWNAGKIPLLLAHPQSAGHGINLQDGGHHMVFYSDFWNLEYRLQAIERLGPLRQMQAGYKRPVYIYEIQARGTLDADVSERHRTKADVQALLMNAMKRRAA